MTREQRVLGEDVRDRRNERGDTLKPNERLNKTKKRRPVTIGIGFIGKDHAIHLASDSEMTWPGYKQTGYEKIVRIKFPNRHFAGLIKAGDWEWADIFQETFREIAYSWPVDDSAAIRNACEKALIATQRKILKARPQDEGVSTAASDWLIARPCHFLLTYMYAGNPFLYRMDLNGAVPARVFHKFAVIGSGSDLASFFLTNIDTMSLDLDDALGAAAYVIDSCIKHSEGCGGPMQFSVIKKTGLWEKFMPGVTEYFRQAVDRVNSEHFRTLPSRIGAAVKPPSENDWD